MGCDIHAYIEYRHDAENYWRSFGGRINPGRDYSMFQRIAGVRGVADPVAAPRGLPENLGYAAQDDRRIYISESEGEGTCTMEQATRYVQECGCEFITDKESNKPIWVTHPDWHSHSWLTADEWELAMELSAVDNVFPPQVSYHGVLGAMRSMEACGAHVRIVFWFDN